MSEKEKFVYNYSAKQQEEIEAIRSKYVEQQETKFQKLKKLDNQVSRQANIISISLGIIWTLIFGLGLCCVLKWDLYIIGSVIGIIGLIGMGVNVPLHHYFLKKFRQKIAPQIIALSDELLK